MMETARRLPRLSFGSGGIEQGSRPLPEAVAVALSFNGSTQAVMMATPADLTDFAYGFALTEGIATPDQIDSVDIVPAGDGIDVQVWLAEDAEKRLAARRRPMAVPVGCRPCGLDSRTRAKRPRAPRAPPPPPPSPRPGVPPPRPPAPPPPPGATRHSHRGPLWDKKSNEDLSISLPYTLQGRM